MKMTAISRTGIDWISAEVNNSDSSKESSCPDFGNLWRTTTMMVTKAISGQQTLKNALCSAMKTSRYAEIISKAESDRVGIQQERERMKTLHSEEKAAPRRGRGAEQLKKEAELVKSEREAARVTLETMQMKVELELEDNLMILKEFEMLSGCSPACILRGHQPVMVLRVLKNGNIVIPLEQLRLRMREEFLEDDDEAYS